MNPPMAGTVIDYQSVAIALGYILMGVLSFFGIHLWNDVRTIKEKWITRDEFGQADAQAREEFNEAQKRSQTERDAKHLENTGNFRRLETKLDLVEEHQSQLAVTIEKRLGELSVQIEKNRPASRADGPERRRY